MKQPGQIALVPFPHTDMSAADLRPVVLLRKASPRYDDWLVCMVSSKLEQAESGLDELLLPDQSDFVQTGLKVPSVLRLSRLAVIDGRLLAGSIGSLHRARLQTIRRRLGHWITEDDA